MMSGMIWGSRFLFNVMVNFRWGCWMGFGFLRWRYEANFSWNKLSHKIMIAGFILKDNSLARTFDEDWYMGYEQTQYTYHQCVSLSFISLSLFAPIIWPKNSLKMPPIKLPYLNRFFSLTFANLITITTLKYYYHFMNNIKTIEFIRIVRRKKHN